LSAAATFNRIPWFDLRRPGIRDAAIVIGLATFVFVATAVAAALRWSSLVDGLDEGMQLNVITTVLLVYCAIAVFFGCTRIRHINHEVRRREAAEAKAAELARHDPMTGLANRRFLVEKFDDALREMKSERGRVAVLLLDINRFKPISELHGSNTADKVLVEFATRLSATADAGNVVGRIDNDVFAVVQAKVHSLDDPTRLARRLIVAAGEPFQLDGAAITLTLSVGIAVGPDDATTADALMRRAELALGRAKAEGRNCVRFFEPEMDSRLRERARIEQELRAAMASQSIILHYQPIMSLEDERIVAFEALARWRSPKLGWVQPLQFISVAEECGLMHELGNQLLRRACRDALLWPSGLTLAFNISPHQARDRALGLRVLSALDETGFDPRRLQLEISDAALMESIDVVRGALDELRRQGVQLALGGFGTGYANVSQLLELRFDKIKISRSIVQRLGKDDHSVIVVRGMVALAGALGLGITAEGIETREQLAKLKAAGCLEGQGFLFGKAAPPADIPTLLRRARRVQRGARQAEGLVTKVE
jgi:diguanylate cyclase (GGDEF)-like protein